MHTTRDRLRDWNGAELSNAEYESRVERNESTPHAEPTPPGGGHWIDPLPVGTDVSLVMQPTAARLAAHVFDLLGAGPTRLVAADGPEYDGRLARFRELTAALPRHLVDDYVPIEWHSDFISGHRWDPSLYYLDVRVAPRPGADIKVPRELSRFQHVAPLAYADRQGYAGEFVCQVLDWISANPVRRGVNWASTMDVAIRAVNWIWGLRLFGGALERYREARAHIVRNLYEHGLHIEHNLEYYAEGTSNHYLSNVAGLLYIGAAFPEFPEADRWLSFGLQELVSEMKRQVNDDGSDYEASTHYHRLVAEMFLSCAALAERVSPRRRLRLFETLPSSGRLRPKLRPLHDSGIILAQPGQLLPTGFYERLLRMVEYTATLTKANGRVPQIGDNDSGRLHKLGATPAIDVRDHRHLAAVAAELFDRADFARLGEPAAHEGRLIAGGISPIIGSRGAGPLSLQEVQSTMHFPDAGVAVLRSRDAMVTITCGSNGQHGRGGHNHNDKGSFELSVGLADWIVDGGCMTYTANVTLRNQFRGTAAHNTLWVGDREQDPVPPGLDGLFRLPERCAPRLVVLENGAVRTEHVGYGPLHRRVFVLMQSGLVIDDEIDASDPVYIGFNFDPEVHCTVRDLSGGVCRVDAVSQGGGALRMFLQGAKDAVLTPGFFSRGYGVRIPNQRLVVTVQGPRARTEINWGVTAP